MQTGKKEVVSDHGCSSSACVGKKINARGEKKKKHPYNLHRFEELEAKAWLEKQNYKQKNEHGGCFTVLARI